MSANESQQHGCSSRLCESTVDDYLMTILCILHSLILDICCIVFSVLSLFFFLSLITSIRDEVRAERRMFFCDLIPQDSDIQGSEGVVCDGVLPLWYSV